ncbi:MAG: hypothetical protein KDK51_08745, partial [Deltaproteobacteria bacterium]|nr:hypothetical protein [Deltaproteobacteria bacterium]
MIWKYFNCKKPIWLFGFLIFWVVDVHALECQDLKNRLDHIGIQLLIHIELDNNYEVVKWLSVDAFEAEHADLASYCADLKSALIRIYNWNAKLILEGVPQNQEYAMLISASERKKTLTFRTIHLLPTSSSHILYTSYFPMLTIDLKQSKIYHQEKAHTYAFTFLQSKDLSSLALDQQLLMFFARSRAVFFHETAFDENTHNQGFHKDYKLARAISEGDWSNYVTSKERNVLQWKDTQCYVQDQDVQYGFPDPSAARHIRADFLTTMGDFAHLLSPDEIDQESFTDKITFMLNHPIEKYRNRYRQRF